ncbi:MAG TPA: class I SAM-dependent methyltransferase [Myxococcota bacterium]|jgi:ubiquinone/menaquinone biosynthesis C-methylase UbiE|nr:class I SAM-dependent methyltransferase [Myxococcota bacterium]
MTASLPSSAGIAALARDAEWPQHEWASLELPPSWTDELSFRRARDVVAFLRCFLGRPASVRLPAGLPGAERLPSYLLQPFHRMPNGNFSRTFVQGYARGFDVSMLGRMGAARARLAAWLGGARRALDVGCGAGGLAAALDAAGVPEVVGLDPSPYLLREAARRHPRVRFVQGLAEATGFPARAFDAAGVCFVFHELPGEITVRAFAELARVLVPGGRLAIVEPSAIQRLEWRPRRLVRSGGLAALYFAVLARLVYEPYLFEWQRCEPEKLLAAAGFALEESSSELPFRYLLARRL